MTSLEDHISALTFEEAYDLKRSINALSKITRVAPLSFELIHTLLFNQSVTTMNNSLLSIALSDLRKQYR